MSYNHQGRVHLNGFVDHNVKPAEHELQIQPKDDGLHLSHFTIGDFEWWYFDVIDIEQGIFLKMVFHIGTDPLKTKIFPQLALSINTPKKK